MMSLKPNQDQDSWKGGTGRADSTAEVTFQQGFPSVTCRRSRLVCRGVYACSAIDPALLDVERHDLDPAARLKVFEAERATRVGERSNVEQRAATCVLSPGCIYFLTFFSDFSMSVAPDVQPSTVTERPVPVSPK